MNAGDPSAAAALDALRAVDFDWTMHRSDVWLDPPWDEPSLHADLRRDFVLALDGMIARPQAASPLGWIVLGRAGSGKTHVLGAFRRAAVARKAAFIFVDMTDVRDFWSTVLQGYRDSLQQKYVDDLFQHQMILGNVIARLGVKKPFRDFLAHFASRRSVDLAGDMRRVLGALYQTDQRQTLEAQDVVRSLICINSTDFDVSNAGHAFLQGESIDPALKRELGFQSERRAPREIIAALSWLLSLGGPTVLAFDQLDAIVQQAIAADRTRSDSAAEANAALAIVHELAAGLADLRDLTHNTLTVAACLEASWEAMTANVAASYLDRFRRPLRLTSLSRREVAESVVRNRLALGYARASFNPPFATWPFRSEAFDSVANDTPREVLKKCDELRSGWLRGGRVREVTTFALAPSIAPPADDFAALDARFADYRALANVEQVRDPDNDDTLVDSLLESGLAAVVHELALPDGTDAIVDVDFPGGKKSKPLHARLRLIHADQREEHFSVRALQHPHYRAFQVRLRDAMTAAGIKKQLSFRRLAIVRTTKPPTGAETEKLLETFRQAGGRFVELSDDDARSLWAIERLFREKPAGLNEWLRARRRFHSLAVIRGIVGDALDAYLKPADGPTVTPPSVSPGDAPIAPPVAPQIDPPVAPPVALTSDRASLGDLPLGYALDGDALGEPVTMPAALLTKHAAILAGAGSGKTVLLKRLVEAAALRGVPAIVVDVANDLADLARSWDASPDGWLAGDAALATRFRETTEVIVWTPGRSTGNPIGLEPLPDLAAVADDADELESAVALARGSLAEIAAPGASDKSAKKQAMLAQSLKHFARSGGGRLEQFIELLSNLPSEALVGVHNEAKLAVEIRDSLRSARVTNPLLRSSGPVLDPAVLFGPRTPDAKTRISVISLVGLGDLEEQRTFVHQLAMTLFAWIKKHPAPAGTLGGLLVIDEAKDFAPSVKSSVCKESLIRLASQARKYGVGLVVATQTPRDVDAKIIGNCSTHYYGKASSPIAIDVIRDQIRQRGGDGDDVPQLGRGRFYVYNADAGLSRPIKIGSPLCLSRHGAPLQEQEILELAAASAKRLRGE